MYLGNEIGKCIKSVEKFSEKKFIGNGKLKHQYFTEFINKLT